MNSVFSSSAPCCHLADRTEANDRSDTGSSSADDLVNIPARGQAEKSVSSNRTWCEELEAVVHSVTVPDERHK